MTLPRWKVPKAWEWVQASEVADIVGGGTPSTKDETNFAEPGAGVPWVGPADLTGYVDTYISRGRRDLTEKGLGASGATLMPKGTVLFSSRAPIGYCSIAANEISTNQGFKSWVCASDVMPEYVRHYLLSSVEYADSLASGTTFREVSGKRVGAMAFPLAPAAEQRRIVAKLDGLTARLARARAELDRVPVLAERLREVTLRKAYSPGTTPAELGDALDPGIDGRTLPVYPLAENWAWQAIGAIAAVTGGLTKNATRATLETQVPYMRVANVYANALRLDDVATIGCTPAELAKTRVEPGDILVVEGNGSLDQVGRAAMWNGEIEGCSHQKHLIRVRAGASVLPEFMLWWLLSPEGRSRIERLAASTSGLHTLSISKISGLPIPVPSLPVQRTIVALITSAFARADRMEAEAARARALIDRLEASILAKAFRGELVPQDPADEPASVLLERIRAQRAAAPKAKRGRRVKDSVDA